MGVFLLGVAALNELVWRTVSTDLWVSFRGLGVVAISVLFLVSQAPTVLRHIKEDQPEEAE